MSRLEMNKALFVDNFGYVCAWALNNEAYD